MSSSAPVSARAARTTVLAVVALLAAGGLAIWAKAILHDVGTPFLLPEGGAEWIRRDEPAQLRARYNEDLVAGFRIGFQVDRVVKDAVLHVRALRLVEVRLDGRIVLPSNGKAEEWKQSKSVDLSPFLLPGQHELLLMVQNPEGPPCVLAYCKPLRLATDEHWEASADLLTWSRAARAGAARPTELSRTFPDVPRAVFSLWYVFVPIFLVGFLQGYRPEKLGRLSGLLGNPELLRWVILAAYIVLGLNNLWRLGPHLGFDVKSHTEYVKYVASNYRIPLATEGWQYFQSPLYYMVSAPVYAGLAFLFSDEVATRLLRLIPLLAGAGQIEIGYRAVRLTFPNRRDLQCLGILFCGLLPMNVYMSQYMGNESAAGVLSSLAILLALYVLHSGADSQPKKALALLGLVWGLALLTKVSALLLGLPLGMVVLHESFRCGDRPRIIVKQLIVGGVLVFGVAALVSGWYYVRNWVEIGRPFIGGWDPSRGIAWWQDPGYRVPVHFVRFGEALFYPVYSGIVGFWDGVYSTFWADGFLGGIIDRDFVPPWNYRFMTSDLLWSIVPTLGILAGLVSVFGRKDPVPSKALLFSWLCVMIYGGALMHHFMTNPNYCAAKAFYTLGATPCYTLLAVTGFDMLMKRPRLRPLLYGCIACWSVASYVAYFVI